jgi:hypothetical protein
MLLPALLSVYSVHHVSGFAKTNTGDERDELRSSLNVARVYVAADGPRSESVAPAPNITVSTVYRSLVEQMLTQSPTFRRQHARIAAARHLSVDIRSSPPSGTRSLGLTHIMRRPNGNLQAVVNIGPCARSAELIAHEMEHIIEQLDGVDLRAKARLRASGVRRTDDVAIEAYETTRAIVTGQRVASELGDRTP